MKYLISLLAILLFLNTSFAEEQPEEVPDKPNHGSDMGRTYHDAEDEIVKEIYSFKEVQRFNPKKPEDGVTIEEVKEGAYFRYFENGQLEVMGTFNDGEKHGTFTYFDEEGEKVKIVTFEEGEIIEEEVYEE